MNSILLLTLAVIAATATAAKLPKSWKTCKRNDPKINDCLKGAIEGAISDLVKGVPSLGVLPLDPLHLIRLQLDQGDNNSPVSINLTFIDIDFHGFRNAKLTNIDADWNKGYIKASLDVIGAPVQLLGSYSVSGKILLLPIAGQGKCNFTMTNSAIDMAMEGSTIDKGGKKYFHADKMDVNVRQDRVYMYLDNLFNGDKALGDNMNKVLNENWQEVFEAFRGTVQKGLGEAFREISNRVFEKVPLDQLAPL